ncbi:hypothetical protein AB0D34_39765 [Streptomyces sp. NPDC048420]|uniref:hypothetical protein n=1 Tax=Streptomyces sp. NPDC048420 TaxID=3155755 RepID=UPI0034465053
MRGQTERERRDSPAQATHGLYTPQEGIFCLHTTGSRPRLVGSADSRGAVGHAGSRLPAVDLAVMFADADCASERRVFLG